MKLPRALTLEIFILSMVAEVSTPNCRLDGDRELEGRHRDMLIDQEYPRGHRPSRSSVERRMRFRSYETAGWCWPLRSRKLPIPAWVSQHPKTLGICTGAAFQN